MQSFCSQEYTPKNTPTPPTKTDMYMFAMQLFMIAKTGKPPKCPTGA